MVESGKPMMQDLPKSHVTFIHTFIQGIKVLKTGMGGVPLHLKYREGLSRALEELDLHSLWFGGHHGCMCNACLENVLEAG